eukprot:TRINITY_DN967_c0_g1_i1.p1 TRINITY_DN967_c0_g1~~TRINITY_DN967_c0_g1_i1.p1  ORF type:complete len:166 (+),score=67.30 TRINITY_DN967_c0_g1_i1:75-500(+)
MMQKPQKPVLRKRVRVPLSKRPADWIFITFYFIYFWTTLLTDYHNVLSFFKGLPINELDKLDLEWPPKIITQTYVAWGETVDPITIANPLFWQVMEWTNVFYLTPMNIFAIYAMVKGCNWFKNHGMIHASFLIYPLSICVG